MPVDQTFPVGDLPAALGAFVEPMAVAVHGVNRGAVSDGEHVVVLGGGPIGQAVSLAAQARGARVLVGEPIASRRWLAEALGAELDARHGGRRRHLEGAGMDEWRGSTGRDRRHRRSRGDPHRG